jgi:hypothetical protein
MDIATLVLEYLRAVLSFPTVVGILGIMFLCMFRAELKSLILRIALLKFGSAELAAPQLPPSVERNGSGSGKETLPNPTPPQLPAGITAPPETLKLLAQAMLAERARAYLWEYRYLNYFLVLGTQRVLDWLASLSAAMTVTAYDTFWQPLIPSAEQRRTILAVLESHNLIVFRADLIEVTPKGREYIQWRGSLPNIPSPSAQ